MCAFRNCRIHWVHKWPFTITPSLHYSSLPGIALAALLLAAGCASPPERPADVSEAARPRQIQTPEAGFPDLAVADGLTLEQAVWMALQQNQDLIVQGYEPLTAGAFIARERGRFSPELFAAISHRDSRSTETARATGEQFGAEVEQTLIEAGVRRDFVTGTDVELSLQQVSESSNRSPDQNEARIGLSLTQALLQGRDRVANLAAVRQAELGLAVSTAQLRGFTESVVAEVEGAYWRYWLATETISIAEQALDVAEQQLADVRQRIAVGQLARNEEAVAQAEAARRRQVLIDARADEVRRRIELLQSIAPGHPATGYLLAPVTLPELPDVDADDSPAIRIRLAEQSRADLSEARLRLEQQRLDTVVTRDGLLPRLDFFAQLAKSGYGADPVDTWSGLDDDSYDVRVGLRFSRTLGERTEAALHEAARFRHDQAAAAVENLRLYIGSRVLIAINELERARQQVEASAETRRLQALTVESEVERFRVGTGTALMVAQAQRDLLASMIEEQRARVQARLALLQLYQAEGSLLDRRGILPAFEE